ncbi:MAG: hypothetical protein RL293_2012, partial [Bacteroidota bacterium]
LDLLHVMSSLKNTLSPGSKNWIPKFFQLLEQGVISLDLELIQNTEADLTHFVSHRTGLVYGNALHLLFSNELDSSRYTSDEKLKLLLFETLLFTYLRKNRGWAMRAQRHNVGKIKPEFCVCEIARPTMRPTQSCRRPIQCATRAWMPLAPLRTHWQTPFTHFLVITLIMRAP